MSRVSQRRVFVGTLSLGEDLDLVDSLPDVDALRNRLASAI